MRAIVIGLAVAAWASPALGGYVQNRAQWNALGEQGKAAYAMGLFDGLAQVSVDDIVGQAAVQARIDCVVRLGVTNSDLADLIDGYYRENAEAWGDPPLGVILRVTNAICKEEINAAVREAGGEPFIP